MKIRVVGFLLCDCLVVPALLAAEDVLEHQDKTLFFKGLN